MPMRSSVTSTFTADFQPVAPPLHRRHIHYSGRVQGVGFRYTVKNLAMRFNVGGYVRNLPDGRVELVLEGPAEEIDQMAQAVADRMDGYIRSTQVSTPPATGEFAYFQIQH